MVEFAAVESACSNPGTGTRNFPNHLVVEKMDSTLRDVLIASSYRLHQFYEGSSGINQTVQRKRPLLSGGNETSRSSLAGG